MAFGLGAFLLVPHHCRTVTRVPAAVRAATGLGPVQLEYIRTEAVPKNGLTATLFYLAERG